jgi:hypothetical protein
MSNLQNAYRRNFSSSKSLNTKSLRPILQRGQSSPKLATLGKKRATEVETSPDQPEDDVDMTFLQYWYVQTISTTLPLPPKKGDLLFSH